ncbi:MAG: hypothetical protein L0K88_12075, partial [Lactiplantibacillus plantarum]|nr:hypothetical protein [Lactiplantibacillus plantarum]
GSFHVVSLHLLLLYHSYLALTPILCFILILPFWELVLFPEITLIGPQRPKKHSPETAECSKKLVNNY